jgi:hypothetical protein
MKCAGGCLDSRGEGTHGRMLQQPPQTRDQSVLSAGFDSVRLFTIASVLLLSIVVIVVPLVFGVGVELLAMFLALQQDLPLALVFMLAWLARLSTKKTSDDIFDRGRTVLVVSVLFILFAGWAGHYIVFQGVDISRDEAMAVFDQNVFAQGQVVWPIPLEWRSMADALNRRFMLPIGANEYWISAYLPIHSAARALVSLIADPTLTSPLFTAVGAASLWCIARKLWPESKRVAVVGVLLFVTSSQVLITSMTAYAMSMHLGLNLLWLMLFLKDRPVAHVLAAVIGFLATGIHQPLFHPLFALPFLTLLVFSRRWSLASFYLMAYVAIAAFWLWWPTWIVSHGVNPAIPIQCTDANCSSPASFIDRLVAVVGAVNVGSFWLTAANLLRFVVWQHPLLLPLAIFGAVSCWRAEPLVKALAVSFLLPVVVMAVLLPWQGHGWGYRYVHPAVGSVVILACYGFAKIEQANLSLQRPLIVTTAVAAVLLVVHGAMASSMIRPYTQLREELAAMDADVVIVDSEAAPFGQDLVVNQFDLANRPKLLIAKLVTPSVIRALCKRGSIGFYDGPRLAPLRAIYTERPPRPASLRIQSLHATAVLDGCRITAHAG